MKKIALMILFFSIMPLFAGKVVSLKKPSSQEPEETDWWQDMRIMPDNTACALTNAGFIKKWDKNGAFITSYPPTERVAFSHFIENACYQAQFYKTIKKTSTIDGTVKEYRVPYAVMKFSTGNTSLAVVLGNDELYYIDSHGDVRTGVSCDCEAYSSMTPLDSGELFLFNKTSLDCVDWNTRRIKPFLKLGEKKLKRILEKKSSHNQLLAFSESNNGETKIALIGKKDDSSEPEMRMLTSGSKKDIRQYDQRGDNLLIEDNDCKAVKIFDLNQDRATYNAYCEDLASDCRVRLSDDSRIIRILASGFIANKSPTLRTIDTREK